MVFTVLYELYISSHTTIEHDTITGYAHNIGYIPSTVMHEKNVP